MSRRGCKLHFDKGNLYGEEENLPNIQRQIRDEIKRGVEERLKKDREEGTEPILQQSDLFKPFLVDIGNYGLNYAYHKYQPDISPDDSVVEANIVTLVDDRDPFEKYKKTKTEHPIDVLVIGAGLAGLSAAYELAQVGHNVTILEMQHRVGGRVKTIGDTHFYKGLWSDAGAMRLPGDGLDPVGTTLTGKPTHFMTDFYAQQFKIPVIPFVNTGSNGFYKFYGEPAIKMSDWDKNKKGNCNHFWPGWDGNLPQVLKQQPDYDIMAYYESTVGPVKKQLEEFLTENALTAWERWIDLWAPFSVDAFFSTSYEGMLHKLHQSRFWKDELESGIIDLKELLPWPQAAVTALYTFSYTSATSMSMVDFVREEMGQWWTGTMHTYEDGMQMLPESFVKENTNGWNSDVKLSNNIIFGQEAYKITYSPTNVVVSCRNITTMEKRHFTAKRLIITLPINIIKGIKFSPPLPHKYYKVFESVFVDHATKVMLQCKTRFWEDQGIQGGFTRTDMPISQIHYPSNPDFKIPSTERGILMCYTLNNEALLFGSQTEQNTIAEVVEELSEIHPEITDQFEVGTVQSWDSDPSFQGAFVLANPDEYDDNKLLLHEPHETLYFCGEAISFTNGWIQGAIESGLIAAFQLYTDNEDLHA